MEPSSDPGSPVQKSGFRTSEFLVTLAGLAAVLIPSLLKIVPEGSQWASILGIVLTVATYVGGRSWAKASGNVAAAHVEAAKVTAGAAKSDPS
jgi:hypothetical protein